MSQHNLIAQLCSETTVRTAIRRTLRNCALLVLLGVSAVTPAAAADVKELLENDLSAAEFERAGLDKLSAEELAYLNERLGRTAPTAETFGLEQVREVKRRPEMGVAIETTIRGEFTGWRGNTRFVLENGDVWQQRVRGRYSYKADSPAVTIVRERFGYYLQVKATGRKIGVKRIR